MQYVSSMSYIRVRLDPAAVGSNIHNGVCGTTCPSLLIVLMFDFCVHSVRPYTCSLLLSSFPPNTAVLHNRGEHHPRGGGIKRFIMIMYANYLRETQREKSAAYDDLDEFPPKPLHDAFREV